MRCPKKTAKRWEISRAMPLFFCFFSILIAPRIPDEEFQSDTPWSPKPRKLKKRREISNVGWSQESTEVLTATHIGYHNVAYLLSCTCITYVCPFKPFIWLDDKIPWLYDLWSLGRFVSSLPLNGCRTSGGWWWGASESSSKETKQRSTGWRRPSRETWKNF